MTPDELRALIARTERDALDNPDEDEAAEQLARAEHLKRVLAKLQGLTATKQSRTVRGKMAQAAPVEQEWRRPPNMSELAAMLGCHRSFLSQAKSGLTRIRLSWAEKIAAVRPDLPATTKTWPKGWAPED